MLSMERRNIFATRMRKMGKRARTRAHLMDAAVSVFARVGYEAASVNEIAEAAEVANGTFYLHFKNKDEIAAVVAFSIAAEITIQLDQAMASIENAAERVSFGTRQFIELGCREPQWGWALFHATWAMPELRKQATAHLRADLERGVGQGVFKIAIDDFVTDVAASIVTITLFGRLSGQTGPEAGSKAAELQLRMLGVPPARAASIAWRALEPLPPSNPADARDTAAPLTHALASRRTLSRPRRQQGGPSSGAMGAAG